MTDHVVSCSECGSMNCTPTSKPDEDGLCEYHCDGCGHYFVDDAPPGDDEEVDECKTCFYSQLDPNGGHCYMFKERPDGRCAQWRDQTDAVGGWRDAEVEAAGEFVRYDPDAEEEERPDG